MSLANIRAKYAQAAKAYAATLPPPEPEAPRLTYTPTGEPKLGFTKSRYFIGLRESQSRNGIDLLLVIERHGEEALLPVRHSFQIFERPTDHEPRIVDDYLSSPCRTSGFTPPFKFYSPSSLSEAINKLIQTQIND